MPPIRSNLKKIIYLITKGEATADNFDDQRKHILQIIEKAVEAKISLVQLREKKLPTKLLFELARNAAQITGKSETRLLINDRADVALAANADGVHLTSQSILTETVRDNFPKGFIIGVSVHSCDKALESKKQGADFVTYSPIFYSPGKNAPTGLAKLREVCRALGDFPVVALGGIDETNYREVLKIANGFAAIRFLNETENFRKYLTRIGRDDQILTGKFYK